MARAGRKRKDAEREPNGRGRRPIKPVRDANAVSVAKQQRIAIGANQTNWRDDRFSHALGRMMLAGLLNEPRDAGLSAVRYAMAERYQKLAATWRSMSGSPSPHAKIVGGSPGRDEPREPSARAWLAVDAEYSEMQRILRVSGALIAVHRVCVMDEDLPPSGHLAFCAGMDALTKYCG